jgi:hypothetical protein
MPCLLYCFNGQVSRQGLTALQPGGNIRCLIPRTRHVFVLLSINHTKLGISSPREGVSSRFIQWHLPASCGMGPAHGLSMSFTFTEASSPKICPVLPGYWSMSKHRIVLVFIHCCWDESSLVDKVDVDYCDTLSAIKYVKISLVWYEAFWF